MASGKTVGIVVGLIVAIVVGAAVALSFPSSHATNTTTSSSSSLSSTSTTATTATTTKPVSSIVFVSIANGSGFQKGAPYYVPNTITLIIGVNNTVVWTNDDTAFGGVIHTVTSTTKAFDSGNLNAGQTFKWTFTTSGTYSYYCVYHGWMKGTVIVKQG